MGMSNSTRLPAEFLAERDAQIFALRKTGLSASDIARRKELSISQVNGAITRQLGKLNKESFLAYPEVLRLELERIDAMQAAVWPRTQIRRHTLDDGTVVTLEADDKAIATVISLMRQRSALLGMEAAAQAAVSEASDQSVDVRSTLQGAGGSSISAEQHREKEARELLALAGESGIFPDEIVKSMLTVGSDSEVVDAEIVDDDNVS
jgi:hypothetical protein